MWYILDAYGWMAEAAKEGQYFKDRTGFGLSALFEEEMEDRKKGY